MLGVGELALSAPAPTSSVGSIAEVCPLSIHKVQFTQLRPRPLYVRGGVYNVRATSRHKYGLTWKFPLHVEPRAFIC